MAAVYPQGDFWTHDLASHHSHAHAQANLAVDYFM